VRSMTPPRRSPARDVTPSRRGSFYSLAPSLRQVVWSKKFMAGHIDKYDGSSNTEEFIVVYRTVIEVAGGDDRVKAPQHCPTWPDHGLSIRPRDLSAPGTSYVPCSSRISRARTSVHLLLRF
jgi:hypothetical protein